MNYSFIGNKSYKEFVQEPDKFYRTYPSNVPLKNYNDVSYQNSTKNRWNVNGSVGRAILKGTYSETPLEALFFSKENIRRIQNKIKKEVFMRTNGEFNIVVDQNENDLLVNMRAVYISDALNEPYRLKHQVILLNHLVIERIVPDMISMMKQEKKYLYDISHPINPIALPVNVNMKGNRSLPSTTTVFDIWKKN